MRVRRENYILRILNEYTVRVPKQNQLEDKLLRAEWR